MTQGVVSAEVGARIKRARKGRGFSAQALADAITARGYAVHRATIAKIENGIKETIPIDIVVHAARVLQVPVLRLLVNSEWCGHCHDDPPVGFACPECGASARRETPDTRVYNGAVFRAGWSTAINLTDGPERVLNYEDISRLSEDEGS